MRKVLAKNEGVRKKFRGRFSRFGSKVGYHGYSEETVLLTGIVDVETNEVVTDHAWFAYTKSFQGLALVEGVAVEFHARVKEYEKGYVNRHYKIDQRKKDFRLSHPTQIKIVGG